MTRAKTPMPHTGPMVFGEAATGFYLRGDHAAAYAAQLRSLLTSARCHTAPSAKVVELVGALAADMENAADMGTRAGLQRMRAYGKCAVAPARPTAKAVRK